MEKVTLWRCPECGHHVIRDWSANLGCEGGYRGGPRPHPHTQYEPMPVVRADEVAAKLDEITAAILNVADEQDKVRGSVGRLKILAAELKGKA